uniref:Uncharacterized protein n=1 Tax=Salix viminalis TaxID=40686 RepID=A0A6N2NF47_SALVM
MCGSRLTSYFSGKNRGKTELTVSGKTSCPRHSWLEDVILLGLTSGNSTYAASSHPWSTIRRLGNYCVLSLDFDDFGRDYSPKFKKNLGLAACRY